MYFWRKLSKLGRVGCLWFPGEAPSWREFLILGHIKETRASACKEVWEKRSARWQNGDWLENLCGVHIFRFSAMRWVRGPARKILLFLVFAETTATYLFFSWSNLIKPLSGTCEYLLYFAILRTFVCRLEALMFKSIYLSSLCVHSPVFPCRLHI